MLRHRRNVNNYGENVIILYKSPIYYINAQDDKIW